MSKISTNVKIVAKEGEQIESLLKRFRKACEREQIRTEQRKRMYYIKPSMLKHQKRKKRERRIERKKRKLEYMRSRRR
ncbi:MAG: 30S ribosomal protein S21 [Spirochaetota bacterium]